MATATGNRFEELNAVFPLRPIRTEKTHGQALKIFAKLANERGEDVADYKVVLLKLIADYEEMAGHRVDTSKVSAGDVVRHLLEQRSMSVNALAKELGMSQGTLNEVIRGRRDWSKTAIVKLADFFRLSTDLFLRQRRNGGK